MSQARPTPRDLLTLDQEVQAVEMRKAGSSYTEIGAALGCSSATAAARVRSAIARAREALAETAEEIVFLDCARLDEMLAGLMPAVKDGDPAAVRAALGVMERRAKMLSLDGALRVQVSGGLAVQELSQEELDAQIARYAAVLAAGAHAGGGDS